MCLSLCIHLLVPGSDLCIYVYVGDMARGVAGHMLILETFSGLLMMILGECFQFCQGKKCSSLNVSYHRNILVNNNGLCLSFLRERRQTLFLTIRAEWKEERLKVFGEIFELESLQPPCTNSPHLPPSDFVLRGSFQNAYLYSV